MHVQRQRNPAANKTGIRLALPGLRCPCTTSHDRRRQQQVPSAASVGAPWGWLRHLTCSGAGIAKDALQCCCCAVVLERGRQQLLLGRQAHNRVVLLQQCLLGVLGILRRAAWERGMLGEAFSKMTREHTSAEATATLTNPANCSAAEAAAQPKCWLAVVRCWT